MPKRKSSIFHTHFDPNWPDWILEGVALLGFIGFGESQSLVANLCGLKLTINPMWSFHAGSESWVVSDLQLCTKFDCKPLSSEIASVKEKYEVWSWVVSELQVCTKFDCQLMSSELWAGWQTVKLTIQYMELWNWPKTVDPKLKQGRNWSGLGTRFASLQRQSFIANFAQVWLQTHVRRAARLWN